MGCGRCNYTLLWPVGRPPDLPGTVGAIQSISYEQVLWGHMAAATIVAALPQLLLSLMAQKYIVHGLSMGRFAEGIGTPTACRRRRSRQSWSHGRILLASLHLNRATPNRVQ